VHQLLKDLTRVKIDWQQKADPRWSVSKLQHTINRKIGLDQNQSLTLTDNWRENIG
jgi:hypothetical protein